MNQPTDAQIFNHMAPFDYICHDCGGDGDECTCEFEPPGEDDR